MWNRQSAMAFAASGSAGCMELLLQSGANVNQLHRGGLTPVVFAATRDNQKQLSGCFKMVQTLVASHEQTWHCCSGKIRKASLLAVQILIEIQGLEKLVFDLDSTVRAPEFSPLVNNLHRR